MSLKRRPSRGWNKLCGYLSAAGIRARRIVDEDHIIAIAANVFKRRPTPTMAQMVAVIEAIPSWQRSFLVKEYRLKGDGLVKPTAKIIKFKKETYSCKAPSEVAIAEFYASWEWKRLSYEVKLERGRTCECCGAAAPAVRINTDHIKPVRYYWDRRMDKGNLQVLCEDCNMGKGSRDQTDFRQQEA